MIHTRIMLILLFGWLWLSPKGFHPAGSECPRTPITQPCIGIERVDAD